MPSPLDDFPPELRERALQNMGDKLPHVVQVEDALNRFMTGSPEKDQKPKRVKTSKQDPVNQLAQYLLNNQQRVTIKLPGFVLGYVCCVHVMEDAITLLSWGTDHVDLDVSKIAEQPVVIQLRDGREFTCMYLGGSVVFGLQGRLISFIIGHDD